jgi:hypothetical protein
MLIDAAAVAKDELGMRKTRLYVHQCYCDEGPTMKKFRPVAQGRLVMIRKRTSHLTVKLAEYDDETYQVRRFLSSSIVALLANDIPYGLAKYCTTWDYHLRGKYPRSLCVFQVFSHQILTQAFQYFARLR